MPGVALAKSTADGDGNGIGEATLTNALITPATPQTSHLRHCRAHGHFVYGYAKSGRARMSKIIIRQGRILDPNQGLDSVADLLIENGKIAAIGKQLQTDT